MTIPAPSSPTNPRHPSKTDDAASEVDAILRGAELACQGAVEEQRGQAVHARPDQNLRLDLSTIAHHGLRQTGQLMTRTLTGLHHLREALGIADVGPEHHSEHPGMA